MLFLHKLLPVFLLPVGIVLLLLIVAIWRRRRWPVFAAGAVLYLSSINVVSQNLLGWLESHYPSVPINEVEPADAIVVLGGIFGPPAKPGHLPNLGDAVDRLEGGIQLHQSGKAPILVFTGGRIPWENRTRLEGEDSRDVAIARGIPAERIVVTREVGNTADEARAVADLMREKKWRRVILITTGWHMPRAAGLFQKAGVPITPFPVDFSRNPNPLTLLDFLPKAECLHDTETALREIYGNVFYRLFR
ncbi:MAG: YdcF family protein [Verrucomicrobia bacterium]|nr:YdcF family protein [Verrucomicrobiota bacterium]